MPPTSHSIENHLCGQFMRRCQKQKTREQKLDNNKKKNINKIKINKQNAEIKGKT